MAMAFKLVDSDFPALVSSTTAVASTTQPPSITTGEAEKNYTRRPPSLDIQHASINEPNDREPQNLLNLHITEREALITNPPKSCATLSAGKEPISMPNDESPMPDGTSNPRGTGCRYCMKVFKNRAMRAIHEQGHLHQQATGSSVSQDRSTERKMEDIGSKDIGEIRLPVKTYDPLHTKIAVSNKVSLASEPLNCLDCPAVFKNKVEFRKHISIHQGYRKYQCRFCANRFKVLSGLQRHERTHTGEKSYLCDFCDRMFAENYQLISHKKLHTGEKPFWCSICKACFAVKGEKIDHMSAIHKKENEDWNTTKPAELHASPEAPAMKTVEDCSAKRKTVISYTGSPEKRMKTENEHRTRFEEGSICKCEIIEQSIAEFVDTAASMNDNTMHIVWAEEFSMNLAAAICRQSTNCILFVKKFAPTSYSELFSVSKNFTIQTPTITKGSFSEPLHCFDFSFPRVSLKGMFHSYREIEEKIKQVVCINGVQLKHIMEAPNNGKSWYHLLQTFLKEDCIIANG